jgi:hypothetical protein
MGEQAQRHKKIEDNPRYQNRERDQRGERSLRLAYRGMNQS